MSILRRSWPRAALLAAGLATVLVVACDDNDRRAGPIVDGAAVVSSTGSVGGGGSGGAGGAATGPCTSTESASPCPAIQAELLAPYDGDYRCRNIGEVPDLSLRISGISIRPDDPHHLLVVIDANLASAHVLSVELLRDADCRVVGLGGDERWVDAPHVENLAHAADGTMLLAIHPDNLLQYVLPASQQLDGTLDTAALGVAPALAGLRPTPQGDVLKMIAWPNGEWYSASLSVTANGVAVGSATERAVLAGGAATFVYLDASFPQIDADSVLVAEYQDDSVALYDVDAEGDPLPMTRRAFAMGAGPWGAVRDPLNHDILLSVGGTIASIRSD